MAQAIKPPRKTEKRAPATALRQSMPFESLRRDIDRVFESFRLGTWELELPWAGKKGFAIAPAVDVAEKDKGCEITAELPGMDEKDIEIKLSDDMLTIKGEKKEKKEEREKDHYLCERCYGSFRRTFQLPAGVDSSKIEAAFAKGRAC